MKKIFYIIAIFASSIFSVQVMAEMKIGVVDAARIMETAPQAEQARKRLEKEFSPRMKKIVRQENDIIALEDRLTKDRAIMKESKILDTQREINGKKRDLRRDREEFREDRNIRFNEELAKLQKQVIEVIQKIGKAENYDLILSRDGVVLWESKKVDITDQVSRELK